MLKAPSAELCQNACGVVNEQKIFCSHQCSPECSMNKFRVYISTDMCFVLPRTHQWLGLTSREQQVDLILTWSAECFIAAGTAANQVPAFTIADTKLYVPVVTLWTQDNAKLLQQLKSGFKKAINCNRYQSKVAIQRQNQI